MPNEVRLSSPTSLSLSVLSATAQECDIAVYAPTPIPHDTVLVARRFVTKLYVMDISLSTTSAAVARFQDGVGL